jgi:hypothetical protein
MKPVAIAKLMAWTEPPMSSSVTRGKASCSTPARPGAKLEKIYPGAQICIDLTVYI